MKKKLLCSLLCAGMLIPAALAAETFSDVLGGSWYADAVAVCSDAGLLKGDGKGNFLPDNTISLAETATIAARMLESRTGVAIPDKAQGEAWYQPYVDYLAENGVTVDEPTRKATRLEFFRLLAAVTDQNDLTPINSITTLPDTQDEDVLVFYNAGILTGVDNYGTFDGDGNLTRAQVAAMTARILEPSLRQNFVPLERPKSASPAPAGSDTLGGEFLMTVNGYGVTREDLENYINAIAYETDYYLYSNFGARLDLKNNAEALREELLDMAKEQAVTYSLFLAKAEELGCTAKELAATLFPDLSQSELSACVTENDLLCAKHILVADEQTASAVLDGLEAVPTLDQFNALLQVFGTDPGMEQNPEGYLFTAGEMVSEFESGVRALAVGEYSKEPVQSQFGYHIIWRLDPTEHPDIAETCREKKLETCLVTWSKSAKVEVDEAAMSALDVADIYERFLASLSAGQ